MSEAHHETLFDLETANTENSADSAATKPVGSSAGQGALDLGIAIPEPFTEPEEDAADDVEEPSVEAVDEVLQNPETAPRKHPNKVSFYQEPEDTARLRGAVLHTMVPEGHRSLSQFVIRAVMKEVQRLEEKYNGGKPFPAVAANEMPQGRPHS